jgi:hypothetical protein
MNQLASAREALIASPPRFDDGCKIIGDVQTRLYGEPGLFDVQPAWSDLRDAADALHAVCGDDRLLAQPSTGSFAMRNAQARWQAAVERESRIACNHLRAAADVLEGAAPC